MSASAPKQASDTPEEGKKGGKVAKTSGRRRFWKLIVWLLIGVIALPSLLTVSGQTHSVLSLISPLLGNAVDFESATLHWWAPVEIRQLSVADTTQSEASDEMPLATAQLIRTSEPLWKIALQMGRDVQLSVQKPQLNLRVTDGRTNLETTLAELFGRTDPKQDSSTWPVSVDIVDGTLTVSQGLPEQPGSADVETQLTNINAHISTRNRLSVLPDITFVANVNPEFNEALTKADLQMQEQRRSGIDPRIAANLDTLAADFPLQPFEPETTSHLSDSTESTIAVKIASASGEQTPGGIVLSGTNLSLADLEPLINRWLPNTHCSGNVACRFQAKMLGNSLTDGVAGRVEITGRGINWQADQFADGESLHFERIVLDGAAAIADDGILLNDLRIDCPLIQCNGQGELRMTTVDPLIDAMRSAGSNSTQNSSALAEAKAASAGIVTVDGHLDLAELTAMLPKTLMLQQNVQVREGRVQFAAQIRQTPPTSPNDVDSNPLTEGPLWRAAVKTQPVTLLVDGKTVNWELPVRIDASGPFSPTAAELGKASMTGSFGTLEVIPRGSNYDITGTLEPQKLWAELNQFVQMRTPGIRGPLTIATSIEMAESHFHLTNTEIESTDLRIRSSELTIETAKPLLQMFDGSCTVDGSASAVKTVIAPWHDANWMDADSHVSAQLIASPNQMLRLRADLTPHRVSSTTRSSFQTISASTSRNGHGVPVLDQAHLDVNIQTDDTSESFHIHEGIVRVPGLDATIEGTLGTSGDMLTTDLTIGANYDLSSLSRSLFSNTQAPVDIHGQGNEVFRVRGMPAILSTADIRDVSARGYLSEEIQPLQVSGRIAWSGGQLRGLALGGGSTAITLQDGMLRTEPIHCAINNGQLHVMPQLDLNTNRLQLATGSRVENLEITPELCREWLGFVAPMLADSANVSGLFSARVHRFDYDLNNSRNSTVQSILNIHSATASPGQSLTSLLQALDVLYKGRTLVRDIRMPQQEIAFEMRDGFIHHNNAEFELSDYRLRSSGAVGLDRQLQLTMDIPLQKSNSTGRTPRSIQVPVRGTIDRPAIDASSLIQNAAGNTIQNKIDNEVDRQLRKLFDRL